MSDYVLSLAAYSIEHGFRHEAPGFLNPRTVAPELRERGEVFVSLKLGDDNRGCMGNALNPYPLFEAVLNNAYYAGFRDTRFKPLNRLLLDELTVQVYHLLPQRMTWSFENISEAELAIKPDHTLIITYKDRRATMLNSMQRGNLIKFVTDTRTKAGIPANVPHQALTYTLVKTVTTPEVPYCEIPWPSID